MFCWCVLWFLFSCIGILEPGRITWLLFRCSITFFLHSYLFLKIHCFPYGPNFIILSFFFFLPFLWVLKLMNSAGCNSGAFILDFHPPTSSPKELKWAFLRSLAHTFRRSQAGTIPVSFTTVRSRKMGAGIVKVCAFVRACVNCLWGESDGSVGKSSCFASPRTWIQFPEPTGERNSNLRPTKQNRKPASQQV